jgi:hypothetical protein
MSKGRYYAFHYYDEKGEVFLGEVTNTSRMETLRLRDEYEEMGFVVPDPLEDGTGIMELCDGPLFETPTDYNNLETLS